MRKTKRIVATILSLGMMLACSMTSFAAELPAQSQEKTISVESTVVPLGTLTGYVNKTCDVIDDGVNLRRTPGLDGERLGILYQADGAWVVTTGTYQVVDGYVWMEVSKSSIGLPGWIALKYIRIKS